MDGNSFSSILLELLGRNGFPILRKRTETPLLVLVLEADPAVHPLRQRRGDAAIGSLAAFRLMGAAGGAAIHTRSLRREARRYVPHIPLTTCRIGIAPESHPVSTTSRTMPQAGRRAAARCGRPVWPGLRSWPLPRRGFPSMRGRLRSAHDGSARRSSSARRG